MAKKKEGRRRSVVCVELGQRGSAILSKLLALNLQSEVWRTPSPSDVVRTGLEVLAQLHLSDNDYVQLPKKDKRLAILKDKE